MNTPPDSQAFLRIDAVTKDFGSFRAVARVASNALLQAAAGSKSIRGVLLARGNLTLPAPDAISVALDIDRN